MSTDAKMIKYSFIYDAVEELYKNACGAEHIAYKNVLDLICSAQTIDAAPLVHGKWKCQEPCPICGKDRFDGLDADIWADWEPPFCPNCGAKMDLEDMSDNFDADIDCIDSVKTNKIDTKWTYETGIESPEILGSGSSFSSVATISNEDDAKEAYKKGGRNYLLRYKYDNARRIIQYWNGSNWESH